MTDTLGNIRSKKLGATGFTESLLTKYADANSGSVIAIVELVVDEVHNKADGTRKVDFVINTAEPATNQRLEDTLREMQRAMYRHRPDVQGQETLQGVEAGPSLDDVAASVDALVTKDETGEPVGVWSPDEDAEKPWPGDEDYKTPEAAKADNVVSFSGT